MENNRRNQCPLRSGFTLLEIMIVLFIVVTLAGMAVGYLLGTRARALQLGTYNEIQTLVNAVDLYDASINAFPTTEQGLAALVNRPDGLNNPSAWAGPYIKLPASFRDPWGNEYQYICPGKYGIFDIWSFGPDRQDGTDDDIGSWMDRTQI